jgi:hypothetical protein
MSVTGLELVEDLVAEVDRTAIRARLEAAGYRRYWLADRGRYELNDTHHEPPLIAVLTALASTHFGVLLAPAWRRWTRLRHGDYALFKDDDRRWRGGETQVEVCVDLSAAASQEGQIVYASPDGNATVSQTPGTVALVDRREPRARYERYLNLRIGDAEIVRLNLGLRAR